MSENTGSVGKRTIASGAIIGFANIYGSEFNSRYLRLSILLTVLTEVGLFSLSLFECSMGKSGEDSRNSADPLNFQLNCGMLANHHTVTITFRSIELVTAQV